MITTIDGLETQETIHDYSRTALSLADQVWNTPRRSGGPSGWASVIWDVPLSDNHRRVLSQKLGRSRKADLRELFSVSRAEALRGLRTFVEQGFLVAAGTKRGAHYLPGPRLPEGS